MVKERTGPNRTQRLNRVARRAQLLESAKQVLHVEGLGGLTMERVAETARISKPVLYSHFANRDDLMLAILQEFWVAVDLAITERSAEFGTFNGRALIIVESYFDVLAQSGKAINMLVVHGALAPTVEAARHQRNSRTEGLWSSAYQRHLGLDAATADALAAVVRFAIVGAGNHYLDRDGTNRDACVRACTAAINGAFRELNRADTVLS